MRARPLAERAVVVAHVAKRVVPFVESGALVVPIAASFPMPDASQAYERFAAGAKLGKVVLVNAGTSVALEEAEAET
jgi:NADPH:quinone reductase